MDNIIKVINNMYAKKNYLDTYGGSVLMTGLIMVTFFCLISYYLVMNNIGPIKADWVNKRCSPGVIPFAGLINPPTDGTSAFDFTSQNFTFCIQSILKQITGYAMEPVNAMVNIILDVFKELKNAIDVIRNMFNIIRQSFGNISKEIFGRLLNVLIPIQTMLIGVKDMMSKTHGIFTTSLYTALGTYMTLKSALGAIFEMIVTILIALAALIVILWIIPFTWGVAATMTGIFATVAIPMTATALVMKDVFDLQTSGLPKSHHHHCFAKDTLIETNKGFIPIQDIEVGTTLKNNSKITAKFKLSSYNQNMHQLGNIKVSGVHKVLYNYKWIHTRDHPMSKSIEPFEEEFIYCLNTSNKTITIDEFEFTDWDDLNGDELREIQINCKNILPKSFKPIQIHQFLDSGFIGETKLELNDGNYITIEQVEVNHVLKHGERVIGKVEIDSKDISLYKYYFKDNSFTGGPNIQISDLNLGIINTFEMVKCEIAFNPKNLYHILTDTNTFTIDGITFFDYNVAIDQFLEKEKPILQSLFR